MTGTKTYIFTKTTFVLTTNKKYVSSPRAVMKSISPEESFELILVKTLFNGNYLEYKSIGDKNKQLSLSKYPDEIYPYLLNFNNKITERNITRKIQLALKLMFKSSKNIDEERELDQLYQSRQLDHFLNQQKN